MRFSTMLIAPAAVAAMSSAGAPSSVTGVQTLYSTQTITITSCLPTVTDCPARETTTLVPIGVTTTTAWIAPPVETSKSVPATSSAVCVPATVTSYVTVCPAPTSSVPATSIPVSSKPATSIPATSVPGYSTPVGTGAYVPKNTTVPYMQANAGTTVQAGSAAIIALAGVVAFFL